MPATRKKPQSRPVGRPSDYSPDKATQAYKLALLGATDKKLADFFGISESTLNLWKLKEPKFSEALKAGKDEADATISESLYHRAKGYSHADIDIRTISVGDGCSTIVQTPIIKHYPPDTTACIFWLKNRQKEAWRDVQRLEHTGKDGAPLNAETASAADLRAELEKRGALLPSCVAVNITKK